VQRELVMRVEYMTWKADVSDKHDSEHMYRCLTSGLLNMGTCGGGERFVPASTRKDIQQWQKQARLDASG
jgi:hypothetical protein